MSQHAAVFYPNLSSLSCQIPSHEFASISSLGVTCFSTLKYPHSNLGTRFFLRGEGCDTPGVNFTLCREIYPNLRCSVRISISLSHLSPLIKLLVKVSPISDFSRSPEGQIWSLLKLLFSERMQTRKSSSNYKSHLKLIKSNSRRLLSDLSPNPIPQNSDLCSTILSETVFSNGILSMSPSN